MTKLDRNTVDTFWS